MGTARSLQATPAGGLCSVARVYEPPGLTMVTALNRSSMVAPTGSRRAIASPLRGCRPARPGSVRASASSQRGGVLGPGRPGLLVGGQRRGQSPHARDLAGTRATTSSSNWPGASVPAARSSGVGGWRVTGGLGDHGRQRPRYRARPVWMDGRGEGGQDALGVGGLQSLHHGGGISGCRRVSASGVRGAPDHGRHGVLAARGHESWCSGTTRLLSRWEGRRWSSPAARGAPTAGSRARPPPWRTTGAVPAPGPAVIVSGFFAATATVLPCAPEDRQCCRSAVRRRSTWHRAPEGTPRICCTTSADPLMVNSVSGGSDALQGTEAGQPGRRARPSRTSGPPGPAAGFSHAVAASLTRARPGRRSGRGRDGVARSSH